jgi:hypothetical protein
LTGAWWDGRRTGIWQWRPARCYAIQRKGPGGIEMMVQHGGFVGVYSHFRILTPAFALGNTIVDDTLAGEGSTVEISSPHGFTFYDGLSSSH